MGALLLRSLMTLGGMRLLAGSASWRGVPLGEECLLARSASWRGVPLGAPREEDPLLRDWDGDRLYSRRNDREKGRGQRPA